jgi:hypothetical protein
LNTLVRRLFKSAPPLGTTSVSTVNSNTL